MPTGTPNLAQYECQYLIERHSEATGSNAVFNISLSEAESNSLYKGGIGKYLWELKSLETRSNTSKSDKKLVKLINSFDKQLSVIKDNYKEYSVNFLQMQVAEISNAILEYIPDVLSLQLTYDKSIFFTFKKEKYSIYLEVYFVEGKDDIEDVVLTIFEENEVTQNFSGNMNDIYEVLNELFLKESPVSTPLIEYAIS